MLEHLFFKEIISAVDLVVGKADKSKHKYIYIYSDKLQYNCTVTRLYNITIQLYSDKAIEKTT